MVNARFVAGSGPTKARAKLARSRTDGNDSLAPGARALPSTGSLNATRGWAGPFASLRFFIQAPAQLQSVSSKKIIYTYGRKDSNLGLKMRKRHLPLGY
jgi:hypothetical protein